LDAINAALYPTDTDYLYFLCSDDGVFYYAHTAEQHEQNIIDAALRDED
jgi:cell division protein YceG involved in septum cleavage